MNILHIPSWYPNNNNKILGIFIKEQIEQLAKYDNNNNHIISNLQFDEGKISLKNFLKIFSILYLKIRKGVEIIRKNNLIEINELSINFSHNILFIDTYYNSFLIANRHFLLSKKLYGNISLIHAHVSFPAGWIAYKLSKKYNIPYIITEHMGPFPLRTFLKFGRPINQIYKSINNANAVLCVSESHSNNMKQFGFNNQIVISNMVDENIYKPLFKYKTSSKINFLTVCNMVQGKGIEDLLQAISLWNPPPDSVQFTFIGSGDALNMYKNLATKLKLDDLVLWKGPVNRSELPSYFSNTDIFVLASKYESFGMVYLEAIACGIPIIATRCGGPNDIVSKNNGILVDVGDISMLSESLQIMSKNYLSYSKEIIRNEFLKIFSKDIIINKILNIYKNVIYKYN
jgi:glycosyltransferase involved in cell wall biosynthesis